MPKFDAAFVFFTDKQQRLFGAKLEDVMSRPQEQGLIPVVIENIMAVIENQARKTQVRLIGLYLLKNGRGYSESLQDQMS